METKDPDFYWLTYVNGVAQAVYKKFEYLDRSSFRYLEFLKEHIWNVNPDMLSVTEMTPIQSVDGEMWKIKANSNSIDNPNADIMALGMVNAEYVAVIGDSVYAIAIPVEKAISMQFRTEKSIDGGKSVVLLLFEIKIENDPNRVIDHEFVDED